MKTKQREINTSNSEKRILGKRDASALRSVGEKLTENVKACKKNMEIKNDKILKVKEKYQGKKLTYDDRIHQLDEIHKVLEDDKKINM